MQEKLLLIRKKKNIKQQDLADLLGISLNQYNLKEKGSYNFTCDEMFEIAKYLHMKIDEIFVPTLHRIGVKKKKGG